MTTADHHSQASSSAAELAVIRLPGLTDYATAWALQRAIHAEVAADTRPHTLLLLEHPPTITMGRRGGWHHLVTPPDILDRDGFELFHIDRGGDITYHGPGQLVGYPIVNLRRADLELGCFVRYLEAAHIDVLARHGVTAQRVEGFTGVWCGNDKITAIGVRVSQWTTLHGFAINLATRLTDFDHIVACGLDGRGVTSLERLTGKSIDLDAFAREIAHALATRFALEPRETSPCALPAVDPEHVAALVRDARFRPDQAPVTRT